MEFEGNSLKSDTLHIPTRRKRLNDNGDQSGSMGEVERPISDTDLLRIMECPVCNEFPAPPIYSCEKGHFTCNLCMELLEACSLCEAPFTKVRNFALESIIDNSNFKCRNAHLGCLVVVTGAELNRHMAECVFRPLDCMEEECLRKNLSPSEYFQHIVSHHEFVGCDKEIRDGRALVILNQQEGINEYRPYYVKSLLPGSEKAPTFLIMTKRHRTFMCWWAVCLEPELINDYKVGFSLETTGVDSGESLSVRWTLPLQPIWKDFNQVRDTGRCAVLPDTNLLAFYTNENSWNLNVEFLKKDITVHRSSNKLSDDYYLLIILVLIGIIAVSLAIFVESWTKADQDNGINQSYTAANKQEFSDEYIGYRGFYYKV